MEYRKITSVRSRLAENTASLPHSVRDPRESMAHKRLNHGLFAEPERRVLRWLAERTPAQLRPDHLTAIGVAGAVLVMVGFVLANVSAIFVTLAVLGLCLNWFGDSLDGTLARYRRIERPRIGYFVDHSCDLISQAFIFIGLGLSPYFTLTSALFALSMYLLISSYTYIKVMILRTHHLSYGGMGATELRVAIACWSVFAVLVGPALIDTEIMHVPVLNVVIGVLWSLVFIGFIMMFRADLTKFHDTFDEKNGLDTDAKDQLDGIGAVRNSASERMKPLPAFNRSIFAKTITR